MSTVISVIILIWAVCTGVWVTIRALKCLRQCDEVACDVHLNKSLQAEIDNLKERLDVREHQVTLLLYTIDYKDGVINELMQYVPDEVAIAYKESAFHCEVNNDDIH